MVRFLVLLILTRIQSCVAAVSRDLPTDTIHHDYLLRAISEQPTRYYVVKEIAGNGIIVVPNLCRRLETA